MTDEKSELTLPVSYTHLDVYKRQLPYSSRNGSMVMVKKIVFEIIADSDSTTLKT